MNTNQTRLRFDHADLEKEAPNKCRIKVVFTFGSQRIEGIATESDAGDGPLRAGATAALKAIEQGVGQRFSCTLEDLDHVTALGKDLIAVLVNVEFERRQFQVFGSCQITGDEVTASVKAVLNATNRFVDLATRS